MNLERFLQNKGAPRIVFCTGAGLSKESGINTFRDAAEEGLWDQVDVDQVCNIANFNVNYHMIHDFFNKMRVGLQNYEPNIGHHMIAEIERMYGDENVIHITANVDDLVERAGGTAMHVHGYLTEVVEPYSTNDQNYSVRDIGYTEHTPTPGVISKPNIVMFGDVFRFTDGVRKTVYGEMGEIIDNLTSKDVVVVIGSSDTVIPWSIYMGIGTPALVINVNPEPHDNDDLFDYNLYMPMSEAVNTVEAYLHEHMEVMSHNEEDY